MPHLSSPTTAQPPPPTSTSTYLATTASRPTTTPTSSNPRTAFTDVIAAHLIAAHTRPGDLVVALAHPRASAEAANRLGRRAAVFVTHRHHQHSLVRVLEPRLNPVRRGGIRVLDAATGDQPQILRRSPRAATLIIIRWPDGLNTATPGSDERQILRGCAAALTRDGTLAVEVPGINAEGRPPGRITDLIARARGEGLRYRERLAGIGDRLFPATLAAPPQEPQPSALGYPARRGRIDLLVFTNSGAVNA